jgi:hypothetical protein
MRKYLLHVRMRPSLTLAEPVVVVATRVEVGVEAGLGFSTPRAVSPDEVSVNEAAAAVRVLSAAPTPLPGAASDTDQLTGADVT